MKCDWEVAQFILVSLIVSGLYACLVYLLDTDFVWVFLIGCVLVGSWLLYFIKNIYIKFQDKQELQRAKVEPMVRTKDEILQGTCGICFEDLDEDKNSVYLSGCSHKFHQFCYDDYQDKDDDDFEKPSCPRCMLEIDQYTIYKPPAVKEVVVS